MVTEVRYTSIRRVLDDLLDHPMLSDLTLEQVVRHTLRFIAKHGYARLYEDRIGDVEIHDFRGLLPCDLISIRQVKDMSTGICMRSMTDSFPKGMQPHQKEPCTDPMNNMRHTPYIPPRHEYREEPQFKTQGRVIFTIFPEGMVQVAYRAVPVDEDGFPMVLDNETYLDALEAYIKVRVFTVKFDQGKLAAGILQNAQADYAASSRVLLSEMNIPSVSEMQSLANIWSAMIPRVREFDKGFKDMANREYLRRHNNVK